MDPLIRQKAIEFLYSLVGQPLLYAIKSPDVELYDFEFGKMIDRSNRCGKKKKIGTHILHILCRFKIIWNDGTCRIEKYYEDTNSDEFRCQIERLIGMKVKRVDLSDKNDLWLDFGAYWVVFATFENNEESWRYFTADLETPHLVVSNSWLRFDA